MTTKNSTSLGLALLVVISLFSIRFLFLDADPSFFKNLADIGDEGYWAFNARNAVLFGRWVIDDFNQPLAGAPLFSLAAYSSFKLFGVGLFQIRMLSAIAGCLTLVFVYFFLRDCWNKKAAALAASLLGVNELFLSYNRLGLLESSMICALVLTFLLWFKGKKDSGFLVLSGLTFALALMVKLEAIYFLFAVILLWIVEIARKEFKLASAGLFSLGVVIGLLPYVVFYQNNKDMLASWLRTFETMGLSTILLDLPTIIASFFWNEYWGYPSVFLLLVPTVLYFFYILANIGSSITQAVQRMNYAEMTSVCWILGASLPIALLSDQNCRRYLMFIVPLSILATKLFLEIKEIDLANITDSIAKKFSESEGKTRFLLLVVLLLPLFSLSTYSLIFLTKRIGIAIEGGSYGQYFALLVSSALCLLITLYFYFLGWSRWAALRSSKLSVMASSVKLLIVFSLSACIILPFARALNIIFHHVLQLADLRGGSVILLVKVAILSLPLIYLLIITRHLPLISRRTWGIYFGFYLTLNLLVITIYLSNPLYSFKETSIFLQKYLKKGTVITGPWAHELTIENSGLPLYYSPHNPLLSWVNSKPTLRHPEFALLEVPEGDLPWLRVSDLPSGSVQIDQLKLLPYPFTGKFRLSFNLYQIPHRLRRERPLWTGRLGQEYWNEQNKNIPRQGLREAKKQ